MEKYMTKDFLIFSISTTVGVIGFTLNDLMEVVFLTLSSISLAINIIYKLKNKKNDGNN